jgi:hypothetical protein
MQVSAQIYHLRHLLKEDRVIVAADISPEQELAMLITRRMLRNLVTALAKVVTDRAASMGAMRDTILDFEHSSSVAAAVAGGHIRDENRQPEQGKQLAAPLSLVQEVKVLSKKDGGLSLVFDNREQVLTIEVAADRIHVVIETFLKIADRAGWDFPPIASWLDGAKEAAVPENRTLN